MFLALREMRHSPSRFVLVTVVIFLVSYLVYFLTGLAYGLASSYTELMERWGPSAVVLTRDANANLSASRIDIDTTDEFLSSQPDAAAVLLTATSVAVPDSDGDGAGRRPRENIYVFGVDPHSRLLPPVAEGRSPSRLGDVVIDVELARLGFEVGDTLTLPDVDREWRVVGISDSTRYQAAPTVFMDRDSYLDGLPVPQNQIGSNGLVLFEPVVESAKSVLDEADLEALDLDTLIDELPGYSAQVLTFSLMIGSLIAILTLVLGIFVYVMMLQKREVFGIMKAQGIRTSYIVFSGVMQTFVLTTVGVGLGMVTTVATGVALSDRVPFQVQPWFFAGVTAAFVVFTVLGGLIPIRTISRIDPIEAIS